MIKHVHWDGGDHHHFLRIILEDENHVEILQTELDTLKMDQLDILQSNSKWRLEKNKKNKKNTAFISIVDNIIKFQFQFSIQS